MRQSASGVLGIGRATGLKTYLDRAVIDEETIQVRERLAGAVGMREDDGGDATADTTRSIGQFDPLDMTNRPGEVFLMVEGRSLAVEKTGGVSSIPVDADPLFREPPAQQPAPSEKKGGYTTISTSRAKQ